MTRSSLHTPPNTIKPKVGKVRCSMCVFFVVAFRYRFGDVSLFVVNGLDRNSKSLAMRIFFIIWRRKTQKDDDDASNPSRSQFHHGTVFSLRTLSVGISKPDNVAQDKIFTGGGATLCKCIGRIYIVPRATIPSNKSQKLQTAIQQFGNAGKYQEIAHTPKRGRSMTGTLCGALQTHSFTHLTERLTQIL